MGDTHPPSDAGSDGQGDAGNDAGFDAGGDGYPDAGEDAADAGADAGGDEFTDAGGDQSPDHDRACHQVNPDLCNGCGKCVNDFTCPLNALSLEGECTVYLDPDKYCYWQCRTYECTGKCAQGAIVIGPPKGAAKQMGYNIHIDEEKCNCCGDCIPSCTVIQGGVIARDSNRTAVIDRALCNDCGLCTTVFTCAQTAIFCG